jgi:uncharacterized protein YodC (DUF2158 family)
LTQVLLTGWFFHRPHHYPKHLVARWTAHGFSHPLSTIIHGVYQVNGMVERQWFAAVSWWFDASRLAQKSEVSGWIFHRLQHSNQLIPRLTAHGSSHPPSTIIHGVYQVNGMVERQWFGCLMMVGCLNSGSKMRIVRLIFSTDLSTQTSSFQDLQPMDPHLHHPKSSMGCIKWMA